MSQFETGSVVANLVMLVLRLSRCLPQDHKVRMQSLDYLTRKGLMPPLSPLRETPEHLTLGSTEDKSDA